MHEQVLTLTDEVIEAINEELKYQAGLTAAGRSDGQHYGVAGQLLTLQTYARRALDAWVNNPGEDQALDELRKCAAIATRAMITEKVVRRQS